MSADLLEPPTPEVLRQPARPAWRQRLVDAESGFKLGLRRECTLFATCFVALAAGMIAVAVGVSVVEAAVLIVALTQSIACTLLRLILRDAFGPDHSAHRMGAAAAMTTAAGALLVAGLLLGHRLMMLA